MLLKSSLKSLLKSPEFTTANPLPIFLITVAHSNSVSTLAISPCVCHLGVIKNVSQSYIRPSAVTFTISLILITRIASQRYSGAKNVNLYVFSDTCFSGKKYPSRFSPSSSKTYSGFPISAHG